MIRKIYAILLTWAFAHLVSAEIAYGESQTFSLGSSTAVRTLPSASSFSASLSVSPNPALSMAIIRWNLAKATAPARLSIFTVSGELVRSFSIPAEAGQTLWNGKNIRGTRVPSGVYIAHIVSGKTVLNKNLVFCR